jgi:hypothetical protein
MGRPLLRFISSIEDRWPSLLGRIGKYPLIMIHKSAVN